MRLMIERPTTAKNRLLARVAQVMTARVLTCKIKGSDTNFHGPRHEKGHVLLGCRYTNDKVGERLFPSLL